MLDRLLQQPEEYRQKIALLLTVIVGIAIFSTWLIIAGYNVKSAVSFGDEEEKQSAQKFRENLPSLRQQETVATDLAKQNAAAKASGSLDNETEAEQNKFLGNDR